MAKKADPKHEVLPTRTYVVLANGQETTVFSRKWVVSEGVLLFFDDEDIIRLAWAPGAWTHVKEIDPVPS